MPKDFEALVNELKILKEAEEEAKKIVENAKKEAEKMIRNTEEQSATIMSETEVEVRKAARDMRQEADAEITSKADNLEEGYRSEVKDITNKASKNIEEAVSYVLTQILETGT